MDICQQPTKRYRLTQHGNLILIDGNTDISYMTLLLMRDYGSYEESSICTLGCGPNSKK